MNDSHQEGADIKETEFGGPASSKKKRIIYFSSGETLEQEEEDSEEEGDVDSSNGQAFREPTERAKLSWKNVVMLVGRMSLRTCDFLGEKLAGVLGLNAAKYQYAIDHHRDNKKKDSQGTGEKLSQGRTEKIPLSAKLDGSQYGAVGGLTSPAACGACCKTPRDGRNEGSHNRAYQEDDDDDEHVK